jgi:hypothetical protein
VFVRSTAIRAVVAFLYWPVLLRLTPVGTVVGIRVGCILVHVLGFIEPKWVDVGIILGLFSPIELLGRVSKHEISAAIGPKPSSVNATTLRFQCCPRYKHFLGLCPEGEHSRSDLLSPVCL